MSDFHYVELYAKFAGFRIMVLANRLGCSDEYSRVAYDKLVDKLDQLIELARETLSAERDLALNPDGPEAWEHEDAIWGAGQELTNYWREPDGINLLRNDVYVDWATKEYYDSRTAEWRFLDGFPPPRVEIGDDRLNGLCAILRQIARETGIHFNTYTTDPTFAVHEDNDVGSDYLLLHGPDW